MIYKDPFYEELKKKNFSLFEIKNLLDNLIEVIVNFGVDYKKKIK